MSKLYRRFGVVVEANKLPEKVSIPLINSYVPALKDTKKHALFDFYERIQKVLILSENIKIYALRDYEIYIFSRNKKHKIFDNNKKLYNYLTKNNYIQDSKQLRQEFKEYTILDFEKIAQLTGSKVISYPVYKEVLNCQDLGIIDIDNYTIYITPCIIENYIYLEYFIATKFIDISFLKMMKNIKAIEIKDSAYFVPPSATSEEFEGIELPFM